MFCEGKTQDGLACDREPVRDITVERFGQERKLMVCQRCGEQMEQDEESEEDDY